MVKLDFFNNHVIISIGIRSTKTNRLKPHKALFDGDYQEWRLYMRNKGKASEIEKSCSVCERSRPLKGDEIYICDKYGLVKPDAVCSSFILDTLRLMPTVRRMPMGAFSSDDFEI